MYRIKVHFNKNEEKCTWYIGKDSNKKYLVRIFIESTCLAAMLIYGRIMQD